MTIEITLLGTFEVRRGGRAVPASAWRRRHAAALVKLLALSPGRRLHREQVIDAALARPGRGRGRTQVAQGRLFRPQSRRDDTIVLRGESVALFPDQSVAVDVAQFEAAAHDALRAGDRRSSRPRRMATEATCCPRISTRSGRAGLGSGSASCAPTCSGDCTAGTTWCSSTGPTKRPIWSSCAP